MDSLTFEGIEITRLGRASFLISGSKNVYFDPWELENSDIKADIILISHEHHDHFSLPDIKSILKHNTKIVGSVQVCEQLDNCIPLKPYEETIISGVKISGLPAYNKDKFRSPGVPFHPKKDNKLGFIVEIDGKKIYHAGDTDFLDQMSDLEVDVALVPVGGTYTMTADEAASAVNTFKPKLAIPMHWGKGVGSRSDAEEFEHLAQVEVKILD